MSALARRYLLETKSNKDAKSQRCQKCRELGHWTYECQNARKYLHRPSRTKMMKEQAKKKQTNKVDEQNKSKGLTQGSSGEKERPSSDSSSSESSDSDSDSDSSDSSSSSSSSTSNSSSDNDDAEPIKKRRRKKEQ
eukprot:gene6927-7706_t